MPEEKEEKSKGKEFISWQVPEYPHYEHSLLWYLGLIIIGAALLVYAIWTHNFLFAFIIIMFAVVFLIHAGRQPVMLKFAITEDGAVLGEKVYPWKELSCFFIIYEPPEIKRLYFEFSGLRPRLSIPLGDQDPVKIRETLLKFLSEDTSKTEEPISEWLGRVFKI